VLGAATARPAGDDAADRAQLHPQIVGGVVGAVYSLAVLGVGARASGRPLSHQDHVVIADVAKPGAKEDI
jgi:hypothetical protein